MSLKIFFAWYDFWVGFYYDQKKRTLYFCPLPMIVISIDFESYYRIIGHYTGSVIGYCHGDDAKAQVLEEESLATFERISKRQYLSETSMEK